MRRLRTRTEPSTAQPGVSRAARIGGPVAVAVLALGGVAWAMQPGDDTVQTVDVVEVTTTTTPPTTAVADAVFSEAEVTSSSIETTTTTTSTTAAPTTTTPPTTAAPTTVVETLPAQPSEPIAPRSTRAATRTRSASATSRSRSSTWPNRCSPGSVSRRSTRAPVTGPEPRCRVTSAMSSSPATERATAPPSATSISWSRVTSSTSRSTGSVIEYRVTGTEIVNPDAIWIVDPTDTPTATLFACHPPGSVAQRIVVHLELAD